MMKVSRKINIGVGSSAQPRRRVMIIYTGGTLGMVRNEEGILVPFDFSSILEHLPVLRRLFLDITIVSFDSPVDSSEMNPEYWQDIGEVISEHYDSQDGFVILHGTDTMAYSASALSFMLPNLSKPVIFTGAQLPISELRSDARENLITSLEIASAQKKGRAIVPEVCIYFNYELIRGCRAKKTQSMYFDAFRSDNYPLLAKAGVTIDFTLEAIRSPSKTPFNLLRRFDTHVAVLKLFPGINQAYVRSILEISGLKGLILETYGVGNAPTMPWFLSLLRAVVKKNILILNISQCPAGRVMQGRYGVSESLRKMGVISGMDMTLEAAITKLMLLMGEYGTEKAKKQICISLVGEMREG